MVGGTSRALLRIRLRLLDLMKSFFAGEPDAEMLSRWRGIFAAMAKQPGVPWIDGAVGEICRLLNTTGLTAIQGEYAALFSTPEPPDRLPMAASGYLDGHAYGMTLVKVRKIMVSTGLVRRSEAIDDEDSLPVLLDLFALLVEAEYEGRMVQEHRCRLLHEILLPMSQRLGEAVESRMPGGFYPACSRLLYGYLLLEKELAVGQ